MGASRPGTGTLRRVTQGAAADLYLRGMLMSPAPLRDRARQHALRPTGLATVLATGSDAPAELRGAVAALGRRPARITVSADVADEVAPVAAELGLIAAGEATLMSCALDCAHAESPSGRVERVVDAAGLEEVSELVAAAFGLDGSQILSGDLYDAEGADGWLLRDEEGHAVSSLVATADPDLLGLWSIATPPAAQRRGHGQRLLRAVLGHYALEGLETACVIATEQGAPLYRTVGFEPAERLRVWMKR